MRPSICLALMLIMPIMGLPALGLAFAPPEEPEADPEMEHARELFDAGVARYTAADYAAAIELWLEAYEVVPPSVDNRLVKAELIYNIARAQQKWFAIDQDIKHLRQAVEILNRYNDEIDELYPADQVALERQKVEEQLADLDIAIAEAEAEAARREAELAERMRPKFDEKADARDKRRNTAMIGSGSALTVLGLGSVGMLVAGIAMAGQAERAVETLPLAADMDERARQVSKGSTGNALMVIGGIATGVFLGAGVPLLAVGLAGEKQRKERRRKAGLEAAAPTLLPGGVGLVFSGRF